MARAQLPSRSEPLAARLEALAERDPRWAGRYALRALATSTLDGVGLLAAGWALLRWERLGEAMSALSAAEAQLPPYELNARLRCRRALLMVRQQRGEGQQLQEAWEALAETCAATGAWGELARTRCEQVAHLNLLGLPAEARALAARIASLVAEHGAPADLARHTYVAGVAAVGCADLDAGLRQLDAAETQFAELNCPAEVARVCIERAWLWLRREQLDQAEEELSRALAICSRLDLPMRGALCLRDLGLVARYRGDYGAAVARFIAARRQFSAIGRTDRAAGCDFNLGAVAHMSGLLDLALAAYRRAEALFVSVDDHFFALVAARNQAMVICAQGRPGDALAQFDALIPRQEALGDQLGLAELRAARAQALHRLGRRDEAAAELRLTHARFLSLGNAAAAAECLLDLAWLLLESDTYTEAHAHLLTAAPALERRPAHSWRVRYGLGRVAEAQGDAPVALRHYTEAVTIVSGLRRQLASEHASSRMFEQARQLHQDALRLAADGSDPARVLAVAEAQRGLVLSRQLQAVATDAGAPQVRRGDAAMQRLQTSLRAQGAAASLDEALNAYVDALIRERHRHLADPAAVAPLDLDQVRDRLTAAYGIGWTVLAPVFVDQRLLLVGLTPSGLELTRETLDPELAGLIARASQPAYRLHLYRDLARLQDPARLPWRDLRTLGDRLLPDWLRARLAPDHRLLVVPCGPLHMLPWAALHLGDSWLCERAIIELSPVVAQAPGASPPAVGAPALLVGCDHFGGRAATLPGALASLEIVAGHWPGDIRRLAGPEASVAAIQTLHEREELHRYGLIHLASHAQLGGADGLLAHIKLADDDLLLDDILQLRLGSALVVLAACEGGAGAVLPGDEVLGLSRALLAAGARSVVANLWPIYDLGTLAFLAPFYRALAAGADAANAVAVAQRALIHTPATDDTAEALLRTPLIWGGFTVTSREVTCA